MRGQQGDLKQDFPADTTLTKSEGRLFQDEQQRTASGNDGKSKVMPQTVEIENGHTIEFPDEYTPQQIMHSIETDPQIKALRFGTPMPSATPARQPIRTLADKTKSVDQADDAKREHIRISRLVRETVRKYYETTLEKVEVFPPTLYNQWAAVGYQSADSSFEGGTAILKKLGSRWTVIGHESAFWPELLQELNIPLSVAAKLGIQ